MDRRGLRRLTVTGDSIAKSGGVPVAVVTSAGTAPDGAPARHIQMVDPTPASGWSWGAVILYLLGRPYLPIGSQIRVRWALRSKTSRAVNLILAESSAANATGLTTGTLIGPDWSIIDSGWRTIGKPTGVNHGVVVYGLSEPGHWTECGQPLIEIRGV